MAASVVQNRKTMEVFDPVWPDKLGHLFVFSTRFSILIMAQLGPIFPGDTVHDFKNVKGLTVTGPGLRRNEVTQAGTLCFRAPNMYWVENSQKRYIPRRGDLVVGIIAKKSGDTLKVDIGSSENASLSMLAFEGATKKQKPDVQVGDVVYTRVLNAHKEMEPELVCVDSYFKAGKLGPLSNEGLVTTISIDLAHKLLSVENTLLRTLGKRFPFEVAIGLNGKVWINAKSSKDILTVARCLEAADL